MFQPDFFAAASNAERAAPPAAPALDLPGLLDRLTAVCERPRYSFMVLNLIAQASAQSGSAGPYVREGDRQVPVRDWLCDALVPVARRDPAALRSPTRCERSSSSAMSFRPTRRPPNG